MRASRNGHLPVIKFLAEKGVDIHVYNDIALTCACKNGHLSVVQYLVENGANVHLYYTLIYAVEGEHLPVVKYIEEKRAESFLADD